VVEAGLACKGELLLIGRKEGGGRMRRGEPTLSYISKKRVDNEISFTDHQRERGTIISTIIL